MKTIILSIFAFVLIACSGRVQTNPLPKDSKIHLPQNKDLKLNQVDEIEIARQFDLWVMDFFNDKPIKKSIWDIGIRKGDLR